MGSQYTKDYTVHSVTQPDSKKCYVHIVGRRVDYPLILKRSQPNFTTLFNKLRVGSTHEFTFDGADYIIDIKECQPQYTCGVVTGFIDMSVIHPKWTDKYYQVLIDGFKEHIILVTDKEMKQIEVNETYMFHYVKSSGKNYYKVTKYEKT